LTSTFFTIHNDNFFDMALLADHVERNNTAQKTERKTAQAELQYKTCHPNATLISIRSQARATATGLFRRFGRLALPSSSSKNGFYLDETTHQRFGAR
jgi:hypothetical protein